MKKFLITAAVVLVMVFGALLVAGCTHTSAKEDINANVPAGAPPLMPQSHEGRFEGLGAAGCYGCHGASERSNPMLNGAIALPNSHYTDESPETFEVQPVHAQCNTCHSQG